MDIYLIIFFSLIITVNVLVYFYYELLARFINIYDFPDDKRKLHGKPVPIIGGLIVIINLILIFFYSFVDVSITNNILFLNQNSYYSFFLFSLIFYLIGLFDDKFNISANSKFTIIACLLVFALWFDQDLRITFLNFSFIDKTIYLNNFSIVFTLFSFLLFINALNMIDGINLLCGSYIFLLLLIIIFKLPIILILLLIIAIIPYLILNAKDRIFLGDGGSILLSYLISYLIIKSYNLENNFYADEIFLIMMIPGIDMVRVAFTRIFSGLHPFSADRNHLHHIIQRHFNKTQTAFLTLFLIFTPVILYFFIKISLMAISLSIFIYFLILFILRNKKIY